MSQRPFKKIHYYIRELNRCLFNVRVSDALDNHIDLEAGIENFINIIDACKERQGKVILIGNGGSAAIAEHIAVDMWKNGRVQAVTYATPASTTAVANDMGYEYVYSEPISLFGKKEDVLIAISSSGLSSNILEAVHVATLANMAVVTLSGFSPKNCLRFTGGLNFYVGSDVYGIVEPAHLAICHYVASSIGMFVQY